MPQGDKDKNDEFLILKWLQRSPEVKSVMALYQKIVITKSTICVESFIIASQSARNAHFFVLCRSTSRGPQRSRRGPQNNTKTSLNFP